MLYNLIGKECLVLVFLFGMLVILGLFNIDMYLLSFFEIVDDLLVSVLFVQLSLIVCLVGFMIGQLIVGLVSDVQGRWKLLLICIFLFVLFFLFCVLLFNIIILVVVCFLQGFIVFVGFVLFCVIVCDVFIGREFFKFFLLLMVIIVVVLMVVLMIGGVILLLLFVMWYMIFYVLMIIGFLLVFLIVFCLKEILLLENWILSLIGIFVKMMGSLLKD